MPRSESVKQPSIANPPAAGIVDDLVAAALLLRCAAAEHQGAEDLGPLCAKAATRLEVAAAVLRGPRYVAALRRDAAGLARAYGSGGSFNHASMIARATGAD